MLISDVRLGAFNGLQLVVFAKLQHPDMIAIVLTGFDDPVLRTEAAHAGALYLVKPIESQRLLDLVDGRPDIPSRHGARPRRDRLRPRPRCTEAAAGAGEESILSSAAFRSPRPHLKACTTSIFHTFWSWTPRTIEKRLRGRLSAVQSGRRDRSVGAVITPQVEHREGLRAADEPGGQATALGTDFAFRRMRAGPANSHRGQGRSSVRLWRVCVRASTPQSFPACNSDG